MNCSGRSAQQSFECNNTLEEGERVQTFVAKKVERLDLQENLVGLQCLTKGPPVAEPDQRLIHLGLSSEDFAQRESDLLDFFCSVQLSWLWHHERLGLRQKLAPLARTEVGADDHGLLMRIPAT